MTSSTDNTQLIETFTSYFMEKAQQKKSKLLQTPVVKFFNMDSAELNIGGISKLDWQKTVGKNPDVIYTDFSTDNRKMKLDRFAVSVIMDNKEDNLQNYLSVTGPLMTQMVNGVQRLYDIYGMQALIGDVNIGKPGEGSSSIRNAATDGVRTVDATQGLTYAKIVEARQNFIKNELQPEDYGNAIIFMSQYEEGLLLKEDKFINNNYSQGRPMNDGVLPRVLGFSYHTYAGSGTGSGNVLTNPVLPEVSGVRNNIIACPESLAIAIKNFKIMQEPVPGKVDSTQITGVVYIGAMRLDGKKVQKLTTTIA